MPGFRHENSPFGGIKERVIEAIEGWSYVQAFSLTWCDQAPI